MNTDIAGILTRDLDKHREETMQVADSLLKALMALDARIDAMETDIDLIVQRLSAAIRNGEAEAGKEL